MDNLIKDMQSLQSEMHKVAELMSDAGYEKKSKELVGVSNILGGWICEIHKEYMDKLTKETTAKR